MGRNEGVFFLPQSRGARAGRHALSSWLTQGPRVARAALVSPARRCFTAEETSVSWGNRTSYLHAQCVFSEQQPDEH